MFQCANKSKAIIEFWPFIKTRLKPQMLFLLTYKCCAWAQMASKSCTSNSSNESKTLSQNTEWSQQLSYVLTLKMDWMMFFEMYQVYVAVVNGIHL